MTATTERERELAAEVKALQNLIGALMPRLERGKGNRAGLVMSKPMLIGATASLILPQAIAGAIPNDSPQEVCETAVFFAETLWAEVDRRTKGGGDANA